MEKIRFYLENTKCNEDAWNGNLIPYVYYILLIIE